MRAERRGAGVGQRKEETWPDTGRIVTMTTRLDRFTQKARAEPQLRFNALRGLVFDPEGLHESFGRQGGKKAPGVERCGRLRLGAGWCNAPSPVLRGTGDRTGVGLRYCGTAGKPGGNSEHQLQPTHRQGPGLLTHNGINGDPSL
jgi:hypothetical protein